jgi:hypothetical protein
MLSLPSSLSGPSRSSLSGQSPSSSRSGRFPPSSPYGQFPYRLSLSGRSPHRLSPSGQFLLRLILSGHRSSPSSPSVSQSAHRRRSASPSTRNQRSDIVESPRAPAAASSPGRAGIGRWPSMLQLSCASTTPGTTAPLRSARTAVEFVSFRGLIYSRTSKDFYTTKAQSRT